MSKITTLFLDIGGVLLTDGWDRHLREKGAHRFCLDLADVEKRHKQYFDLFETDQINLDEYLEKVVFFKPRGFTRQAFKKFMFESMKPYPKMLSLFLEVKTQFNLRVFAVSNEGRELAEYRINNFNLTQLFDAFLVSSFVHLQKPNDAIYKMALDVSQAPIESVLYIDDRKNLIEKAESLGIPSLLHTSYEETKDSLLAKLQKGAIGQ